jgi:hypothetical protein
LPCRSTRAAPFSTSAAVVLAFGESGGACWAVTGTADADEPGSRTVVTRIVTAVRAAPAASAL